MRLTALFALLLAFIPMPESKCQGAVNFLTVESGVDYVASCILDDSAEPIPDDNLISMHSAVPVNFKYGFIFTNPEINHYLPGGYQGISIGLKNFGALESRGLSKSTCLIGYPVSTYIFQ